MCNVYAAKNNPPNCINQQKWKPLPEIDDARDAEVYIHPRHFNSYLEKLCVWNIFFAIGEKNRTLVLKHCEKKISTEVHRIINIQHNSLHHTRFLKHTHLQVKLYMGSTTSHK